MTKKHHLGCGRNILSGYVNVDYDSRDASFDPTHEHRFNDNSFDFFDPSTETGRQRAYYTSAKFRVTTVGYLIFPFRTSYLLFDSNVRVENVRLPRVYDKSVSQSTLLKTLHTKLGHKIGKHDSHTACRASP